MEAAAGLFVSAGAFADRLLLASTALAAGLYLAYGAARLVSLVLDGMPQSGILAATAVELLLGLLCLVALWRMSRRSAA